MKSFAVLAALSALVAQVYATINTPTSLVQCEPALVSWTATTSPYFLSVFPGGQTSGALKTFDQTDATSITWTVDIKSGTSVTLALRDGTGQQFFSDAVTIDSSSDSSCINSSATESVTSTNSGAASASGSASSGSSATTTGSSASGSSSSSKASSGSSGSSTSTSAGSSSSSSTSSAGDRISAVGAAGLAGVLGFVGAALF